MTKSISTTEFMSNFGKYHDEARQHPITLTKHGRPSVVVVSADLYQRMTAHSDPRRAYGTGEMPKELADAFLMQLEADSAEFKGTEND
ncbi:type II toxin-antitoxin system Phd/YefM family antitoxin [Rhizobium wenxiniae]|uniref:type II toxin-antitoxin system Phd/YefM family antitoxin n=1 Tax=Rhizobium wenxiniae TaxID=1737357 RepID=UPI003C28F786